MLRKLFFLVSLVLIAAFSLSACGPAATTAAPAAPVTQAPAVPVLLPTATAAPVATAAPAKPVKITWWHISTAEAHKALFQKYGR